MDTLGEEDSSISHAHPFPPSLPFSFIKHLPCSKLSSFSEHLVSVDRQPWKPALDLSLGLTIAMSLLSFMAMRRLLTYSESQCVKVLVCAFVADLVVFVLFCFVLFCSVLFFLLQPKPLKNLDGQVCEICGDEVGLTVDGDLFVACNECGFPVCRPCYEYERREGSQLCPQCKTRYKRLKGKAQNKAITSFIFTFSFLKLSFWVM